MEKNRLFLISSILILAIPSVVYLLNSNGLSWDTLGHIAEAKVYRENIFPAIYGWNSFFLFGYPIHTYPPFSRLLAAPMSYFLGDALAVRLLLALSCVATPLALYLFLRNNQYSPEEAGAAAIFAAFYMAAVNTDGALNLLSAYMIGLYSNFLALPLLLLALAYFGKDLRLCAIFSALTVLTNVPMGIILAMCLAILFLLRLHGGNIFSESKRAAALALIIFMLVSCWALPMVYRSFSPGATGAMLESDPGTYFLGEKTIVNLFGLALSCVIYYLFFFRRIGQVSRPLSFVAILLLFALFRFFLFLSNSMPFDPLKVALWLLSFLAFLYLYSRKDRFLLRFTIVFYIIYFIGQLSAPFIFLLSQQGALMILHSYRLLSFADLMEFAIIGIAAYSILSQRKAERLFAPLAIGIFILTAFSPYLSLQMYLHQQEFLHTYDFTAARNATGRVLVYDGDLIPYPHSSAFQHFFIKGSPQASGLFVETAPLSALSFSYTENMVRGSTFAWGKIRVLNMGMFGSDYESAARFYSNLLWVSDMIIAPNAYNYQYYPFGANHNASNSSLSAGNGSAFFNNTAQLPMLDASFGPATQFRINNVTFWQYRLGDFPFAEAVEPMFVCTNSWPDFVADWLARGDRSIYYDSCVPRHPEPMPQLPGVELLNRSNGFIRLRVDSQKPAAVLVKEAYDPGWRAYSGGEEVKVYRATPGLIMVFAGGEITLEYQPGIVESISLLITLLGAAGLILYSLKLRGQAAAS